MYGRPSASKLLSCTSFWPEKCQKAVCSTCPAESANASVGVSIKFPLRLSSLKETIVAAPVGVVQSAPTHCLKKNLLLVPSGRVSVSFLPKPSYVHEVINPLASVSDNNCPVAA